MNKNKGFTLVELLIAIFITVSIGSIIFSIFLTSLRSSKKSSSVSRVRENGNGAIMQMSRMIQFAQEVNSPCNGSSQTSIIITGQDGEQTTYTLNSSGGIASQSGTRIYQLIDTSFAAVDASAPFNFTCSRTDISMPPTVGITFRLRDAQVSSFAEDEVLIPFRTSVTLRNLPN